MDKAQALVWLRKSAAQGDSAAQLELGVMYATGDGVKQDDKMAVALFQKAATQGKATAQYNLGLMYAKGDGVKKDYAQAIAWFRKAAEQGEVRASSSWGWCTKMAKASRRTTFSLSPITRSPRAMGMQRRLRSGITSARNSSRHRCARRRPWLPTGKWANRRRAVRHRRGKGQAVVAAAAPSPARPNKCSATGTMDGEKFAATNCAVSLFGDQHSVAIWFNEDPISPAEAENFQISSYADGAKGGKQRTLVHDHVLPGGGAATASAAAVKSIDLNTNHAKSPLAGIQWVVESPKDFKVEKMTGDVKPGGNADRQDRRQSQQDDVESRIRRQVAG